jgi:dihydrofolate synthase/folylpolyglutamate synthase
MFSSPHLEHFGERFRFDGKALTMEEFEASLHRLADRLGPEQRRSFEQPHGYRTVFEVLTAVALVEFGARARRLRAEDSSRRPQVVCWETGLGGRLDCTNVVDPAVSVITALGMDHMKILGGTIEEIAAEKAGIIKKGRPVIVARQAPEFESRVWPVLRQRAEEVGAPLIKAWEHNPVLAAHAADDGLAVRVRFPDGSEGEGVLPLRGGFQAANLEAALAAAWYVARGLGVTPTADDFLRGLPLVSWPGRVEVLRNHHGQVLVLDGAHCPLSAKALGLTLRDVVGRLPNPRFVLLFGMQRDKQHAEFLTALAAAVSPASMEAVFCYPLPKPRGTEAEELVAIAQRLGFNAMACAGVEEALRLGADSGQHLVATGTLYSLADFRRLWTAMPGHA